MTLEGDQRSVSVHRVRTDPKKAIRKKKGKKAVRRPAEAAPRCVPPGSLQKLFLLCRDVFQSPRSVPRPSGVQALCRVLDTMRPEDVGLSSNMQFLRSNASGGGIPRVAFTTIYSCHKFSLCLFFLPTMGVIPLHNHPGMTVFSKLLLGAMHIKAYDWVDSDDSGGPSQSSRLRLARLKANRVFEAPCDTSVLYPTSGGNIHAFTAITPCVVLDVIGPPYSRDDGRDCTYYKEIPRANSSNAEYAVATEKQECYGWLEEMAMPEGSGMDEIEYLGPQIDETGR